MQALLLKADWFGIGPIIYNAWNGIWLVAYWVWVGIASVVDIIEDMFLMLAGVKNHLPDSIKNEPIVAGNLSEPSKTDYGGIVS